MSKDVIYKMMENEKFKENKEIQKAGILETSVPDELKKRDKIPFEDTISLERP